MRMESWALRMLCVCCGLIEWIAVFVANVFAIAIGASALGVVVAGIVVVIVGAVTPAQEMFSQE